VGFIGKWQVTAAGYAAAALFLWLYIGAKSDVKAGLERCNTEKMAAVAQAESLARVAVQTGLQAEIDRLEKQTVKANRARAIAEEAALLADARIPEVREVIRVVANTDACIDTNVPAGVLDALRN